MQNPSDAEGTSGLGAAQHDVSLIRRVEAKQEGRKEAASGTFGSTSDKTRICLVTNGVALELGWSATSGFIGHLIQSLASALTRPPEPRRLPTTGLGCKLADAVKLLSVKLRAGVFSSPMLQAWPKAGEGVQMPRLGEQGKEGCGA